MAHKLIQIMLDLLKVPMLEDLDRRQNIDQLQSSKLCRKIFKIFQWIYLNLAKRKFILIKSFKKRKIIINLANNWMRKLIKYIINWIREIKIKMIMKLKLKIKLKIKM